jgi:16S rRNA (cytidine1402-2'-O)-methyltransferase
MIPLSEIKKNKYNYGLYVVSTPIGNLRDITLRALDILSQSAYILCEDTRVSKKLLDRYNVKSILISNHKFNEKKNISKIIKILKSEKIVSIISDAGTPSISDPGKILINECIKNKINIYPITGASAITAAFSISGFDEKFFFYGFFPEKKKDIEKDLLNLSKLNSSIIFFISPNKINKAIEDIKNFFQGRKILICREISKLYEDYVRIDVDDLKPYSKIPKGELTLVISENVNLKKNSIILSESDKKNINQMIKTFSIKDIIKQITKDKEISKKVIYDYCLSLKK